MKTTSIAAIPFAVLILTVGTAVNSAYSQGFNVKIPGTFNTNGVYSGETKGVLAGWNLESDSITISTFLSGGNEPIMPQHVWIKRDEDFTYLLIDAKGLKEYLKSGKGPVIFHSHPQDLRKSWNILFSPATRQG
jgi:hypothetical protein